jgi:hypothetical protein
MTEIRRSLSPVASLRDDVLTDDVKIFRLDYRVGQVERRRPKCSGVLISRVGRNIDRSLEPVPQAIEAEVP